MMYHKERHGHTHSRRAEWPCWSVINRSCQIYLVTRRGLLGSDLIWIGSLRGYGHKQGQNSHLFHPEKNWTVVKGWSSIQNDYPTTGAHPLPKLGWVTTGSKRSMLTRNNSEKFLGWPASSVLHCWGGAYRPQGLAVTWQQAGCPSTYYLLVFTHPPATAHLYTQKQCLLPKYVIRNSF